MILLDTNVISEAIKPMPHPSVRGWLDAQAAETLFLSSVTVAEMTFGIRMLPAGRRKQALEAALAGVLAGLQGSAGGAVPGGGSGAARVGEQLVLSPLKRLVAVVEQLEMHVTGEDAKQPQVIREAQARG